MAPKTDAHPKMGQGSAPSTAAAVAAEDATAGPLRLFIGVFTAPPNVDRRRAVRETWGNVAELQKLRVAYRFFLGHSKVAAEHHAVQKEADEYGDIVHIDAEEGYYNIAKKAAAVAYYGARHVQAELVMKTDDDAYVIVSRVLRSLAAAEAAAKRDNKALLLGYITKGGRPHRNKASQWYVSPKEWPSERYPPFAHGPGYMYSRDVAEWIAGQMDAGTLWFFKLEDVCFGSWVEKFAEQTKRRVHYVHTDQVHITACAANSILAHYQKPDAFRCMRDKEQRGLTNMCCNAGEAKRFVREGAGGGAPPVSFVELTASADPLTVTSAQRGELASGRVRVALPRTVTVGSTLVVEGKFDGSDSFAMDLMPGDGLFTLAFHLKYRRLKDTLVTNVYLGGKWGGTRVEKLYRMPLHTSAKAMRAHFSFPARERVRASLHEQGSDGAWSEVWSEERDVKFSLCKFLEVDAPSIKVSSVAVAGLP